MFSVPVGVAGVVSSRVVVPLWRQIKPVIRIARCCLTAKAVESAKLPSRDLDSSVLPILPPTFQTKLVDVLDCDDIFKQVQTLPDKYNLATRIDFKAIFGNTLQFSDSDRAKMDKRIAEFSSLSRIVGFDPLNIRRVFYPGGGADHCSSFCFRPVGEERSFVDRPSELLHVFNVSREKFGSICDLEAYSSKTIYDYAQYFSKILRQSEKCLYVPDFDLARGYRSTLGALQLFRIQAIMGGEILGVYPLRISPEARVIFDSEAKQDCLIHYRLPSGDEVAYWFLSQNLGGMDSGYQSFVKNQLDTSSGACLYAKAFNCEWDRGYASDVIQTIAEIVNGNEACLGLSDQSLGFQYPFVFASLEAIPLPFGFGHGSAAFRFDGGDVELHPTLLMSLASEVRNMQV